jgi:hypothetical protein
MIKAHESRKSKTEKHNKAAAAAVAVSLLLALLVFVLRVALGVLCTDPHAHPWQLHGPRAHAHALSMTTHHHCSTAIGAINS